MTQSDGTTKTVKFIAVILGCVLIPLMYSFFYLKAFWDPYSRLDKLPVAVVNNDTGALIKGEERNIGKDICDELKDEKALKFIFTDEKTAREGTKGNQYYAMLTIPKNFSREIAGIDSENKKAAVIKYMVNDKRNYLASQILGNAVRKIEKKVTSDLNKEITGSLSGKLMDMPNQLSALSTGMDKMQEGAIRLEKGTVSLVKGVSRLSAGADKLDKGALKLKKGTVKLNSGAKRLSKGGKKIAKGAGILSKGTKEVDKGSNSIKKGATSLNTGLGTLKKGFGSLTSKLPDLTQGIAQLDEGLNNSEKGLVKGLSAYLTGVKASYDGSSKLASATEKLKNNITNLMGGLEQYNPHMTDTQKAKLLDGIMSSINAQGGTQTLKKGVIQLNDGMAKLKGGLKVLSDKNKKLNAGMTKVGTGIKSLNSKVPELSGGVLKLGEGVDSAKSGSDKLDTGISKLGKGTSALASGAGNLKNATGDLSAGAASLAGGTQNATIGLDTLKRGTENLKRGSDALKGGSGAINRGSAVLASAIGEGSDIVKGKAVKAKEEAKKLEGLDEYSSNPVDVKEKEYQYVANYGTAFAPYFMSLSLWVGGLIIFFGIYYDIDRRFKWLCRDSDRPLLRSFVYLLLGLAQAVLLAIIVKYALGLEVNHMGAYFASCLLVSVVFISIIQFCIVHLGDVGKFMAMLLLILQLTSCGGTFPMETVPRLFNVLYPFMPMTYSVGLFKETISGNLGGDMAKNVWILIGMLIASMLLTIIFSVFKRGKKFFQERVDSNIGEHAENM